MSVFRRSGLVYKRTGVYQLLFDQVTVINLKPVSRIEYKFDPFSQNTKEFRDLMFFFSGPKTRETNVKCTFKTEIVCDQSEPTLVCKLTNGKNITFKTANLTAYEVLKEFNRIVLPLVPPPQEDSVPTATKSEKKKK